MEELTACEGTVHSVIFQNAENGYTVLRLLTEEGEVVTVVGCIPCVAPGEHLSAVGTMETHPQHGEQLRAVELERSLPEDEEEIASYLGSGVVKGVGPATARRIVDRFGTETLDSLEREPERALATVVELCKTRLPEKMGIPADQIQVLTPTRKGPCGTIRLNGCLQEALNPPAPDKREILWGERLFRQGDRIMQTRNDYDVVWEKDDGTVGTGMFNGDVGKILEIDPSGELLVVRFDDRTATYTSDMLSEVDLAYAQTVHKAQGSEYRAVVFAAMPSAPSLMVRGVLYTALTRARELLIVVGDDAAIRSMAENDRRQKRYSGLKWRLSHAGE